MNTCKTCESWNDGICELADTVRGPKLFDIIVKVADDHGLETSLRTGPDFGCVHHSSPAVRLGTLNVETDWDFSLELNGTVYSDSEFSIDIDSMDQLESIQVLGPFGSPSGGKQWEILAALEAIKANPNEFFSNQGGNRGAMWHPKQQ